MTGLVYALCLPALCRAATSRDSMGPVLRPPRLSPDYAGIVIPPNIAPLNFAIEEPEVARHRVRILPVHGRPLEVTGKSASVEFPMAGWCAMLESNRGERLVVEVEVRSSAGDWRRFAPVTNLVSADPVDGYLVYRLLRPVWRIGSGNPPPGFKPGPRISPDGRWLLFCLAPYGNFPAYHAGSDLHLMNLETRRMRRLEINSDQSDSWHCWSSNSRWIVFSSKRRDQLFTRPYFSHVDEQGNFSKPFLLPQRDPRFYDAFVKTYNLPEFVREPVTVSPESGIPNSFSIRE